MMWLIVTIARFFLALFLIVFLKVTFEAASGISLNLFGSAKLTGYIIAGLALVVAVLRPPRRRSKISDKPAADRDTAPPSTGRTAPPILDAEAEARVRKAEALLQTLGDETRVPPPSSRAAQAPDAADTDDRIDPILLAASCQAILFREHFPPPHGDKYLSFFGGVPVGPPGLVWPRVERSGGTVPLHFVMQIDCAEVPASARLGLLPDSGVLHVFLSLPDNADDGRAAVLYSPGGGGDWAPLAPPADLPPAYAAFLPHAWPWALTAKDCPPLLPRWAFQPVAAHFTPAVDWRVATWHDALLPFSDKEAKIVAAQGEPLPAASKALRQPNGAEAVPKRPFPGFPQDWRAVQITAVAMRREIASASYKTRGTPWHDLPEAERAAMLKPMAEAAQHWFDTAAAQPPHESVPAEQREACWQWLADSPWFSIAVLEQVTYDAVQASLAASPQAAARIPADVADAMRARHALAWQECGFGKTYTRTNDDSRMLGMPFDPQAYNSDLVNTKLQLFAIAASPSIGQHHCCIYQLWIAPEQLKARHFDRVEFTVDGY